MATLGEAFRSVRQSRGLTLAGIEAVTKIRRRYLEALESDNFSELPPSVYVRGYVRAYATLLGLDPAAMLALYEEACPKAQVVGVQREVRTFRAPGALTGQSLIAIIVVAVLTVAGFYLYQQYNRFLSDGPPLQTAGLAVGARIGPTPLSALAADPTAEAEATSLPEPTPTPSPTPTPVKGVHIEVKIIDRSWLRVTVDDRQVYEGMPQVGSVLKWDGKEKIYMRTGNAAGTEVAFNGKPGETLGAPGEVKDVQWTAAR